MNVFMYLYTLSVKKRMYMMHLICIITWVRWSCQLLPLRGLGGLVVIVEPARSSDVFTPAILHGAVTSFAAGVVARSALLRWLAHLLPSIFCIRAGVFYQACDSGHSTNCKFFGGDSGWCGIGGAALCLRSTSSKTVFTNAPPKRSRDGPDGADWRVLRWRRLSWWTWSEVFPSPHRPAR